MDPAIAGVVSSVMAVLMPYVTKGAEAFAHLAGQAAFEKVKGLYESLKARWAGDREASDTLANFEQKPSRYRSALEDILKEKLGQDSALLAELANRLKEMGPVLNVVQKLQGAEGVVGAQVDELAGGRVNVAQDIEGGKNIVGAKIGKIG